MKIIVGCDHAGFPLKQKLLKKLQEMGKDFVDCGTHSEESCDYPDFAHIVAEKVMENSENLGLLICGSGIGMSISANRHHGVRAALCRDALEARLSREHNDSNILVLGCRLIGEDHAVSCLETFLSTAFSGGRHERRVKKIDRSI